MTNTNYQKALKVISIICIVFGAIAAILTIALMALTPLAAPYVSDAAFQAAISDAGPLASQFVGQSFFDTTMWLWAGGLISAIFIIVLGILGLRGANDPQKIKPFLILAEFALAYECCSVVISMFTMGTAGALTLQNVSSTILSSIIGIAIAAISVWLAFTIKKQTEARLIA